MRMKLDRTLCDGFGQCAVHAPHLFSLDEWGYANLRGNGEIANEDAEAGRRALLDCPVHAITELSSATQSPNQQRDLATAQGSAD